jgi:hypothetical protein
LLLLLANDQSGADVPDMQAEDHLPPRRPPGWQVRPEALAPKLRDETLDRSRWLWHWRSPGVTVVMRGKARRGGAPHA